MSAFKLLTEPRSQSKLAKGEKRGYLTAALHLAPHNLARTGTVCPGSTPDCRATCLHFAGRSEIWKSITTARIRRTKLRQSDPARFDDLLRADLRALMRLAHRRRMIPAVRLNATSDIDWAHIFYDREFQPIRFYDYTKVTSTWTAWRTSSLRNWHVTWSHDGSLERSRYVLRQGGTVAVVFHDVRKDQALPAKWQDYPVIDGDVDDLRFLDPPGVVVGLRPKGAKLKRLIAKRGHADFTASAWSV